MGSQGAASLYLPGSSDPDTPDAPTVEGKEVEEVETSLEAMLPGAIAWADADADGQTPSRGTRLAGLLTPLIYQQPSPTAPISP